MWEERIDRLKGHTGNQYAWSMVRMGEMQETELQRGREADPGDTFPPCKKGDSEPLKVSIYIVYF